MNSEYFLSTWMRSRNLSQFNKPHLFLMLIQIDFESFVSTDQGWSFRFCTALFREDRTRRVSRQNIFGVAAEAGFFIFIYIYKSRPTHFCHLYVSYWQEKHAMRRLGCVTFPFGFAESDAQPCLCQAP